MNRDYFGDLNNETEIKKHYYRLAMKYHPDKGGDTRIMQDINAQYLEALKRADGTTRYDSERDETFTYKYYAEKEQAVIDKIDQILKQRLPGIEILLIGKWVWITGDTKPVKDQIKACGFKWHNGRQCWFWHEGKWYGKRSNQSLEGLAAKYGAERYQSESLTGIN